MIYAEYDLLRSMIDFLAGLTVGTGKSTVIKERMCYSTDENMMQEEENMLADIQLMQIKNQVKRVLHVPGNYTGGILEMAIVADYAVEKEELTENIKRTADALKRQDEIFRNVRLNLIKWISDEQILKEVSSLTTLQMGRGFEDYEKYCAVPGRQEKSADELFRQLKLFYARSKLILVFTDGAFKVADQKTAEACLQPFLGRKMLFVQNGKGERFSF